MQIDQENLAAQRRQLAHKDEQIKMLHSDKDMCDAEVLALKKKLALLEDFREQLQRKFTELRNKYDITT